MEKAETPGARASSEAGTWVSDETREVVVQEVLAGGWITAGDPAELEKALISQRAGVEVHEAVRGLFGTMAHSLLDLTNGDSFPLTCGGSFTEDTGAALLFRLPMAAERQRSLLDTLYRDFVAATSARALCGPWWEPVARDDGSIVLAIDRNRVPPPPRPRPPRVKATMAYFGANQQPGQAT